MASHPAFSTTQAARDNVGPATRSDVCPSVYAPAAFRSDFASCDGAYRQESLRQPPPRIAERYGRVRDYGRRASTGVMGIKKGHGYYRRLTLVVDINKKTLEAGIILF